MEKVLRIMFSQIPIQISRSMTSSVHSIPLAVLRGIKNLWWHDLRATFCTRLALARYEALTIMSLMGHKDLKTTMRYIRAVQLQRRAANSSCPQIGHK